MAVPHDKCRPPSLFLPSRRVHKDRKLVCSVESRPYHELGDRQTAMELEGAMGVNYAVL